MQKLSASTKEQIENELLSTVGRRYRQETFWVIFLALICAAGTVAWMIQLKKGLGVTAMRDYASWGLYISLLFFFVGVSLIGAFISSVLRFSNARWRYPLIRIAEAVTLSAIFFAGFMPVLDMGRPERLYFLITHGRIQSPILWDVVAIATYFTGSVLYFYLPLIPDLAIMRDRIRDAPKFRKKAWRWLAMNWQGTDEQHRLLNKAMKLLAVVILPVAISVHTISAWLIAMTLRPGWNTSLMGPYFVFGALMAGTAILILIIAKLRHGYRLEHCLTPTHFNNLAKILLGLTAFYLYLNINKYGVPAYKMTHEERFVLNDLFKGRYALFFWYTQVGGLVLPIVLLAFKKVRHSIRAVVWVAVMVLLGALINRYIMVVPNMLHPFIPIQGAHQVHNSYVPTLIEWTIVASSLAGFVLLIILLFKPFPIITIWEVEEELEKHPESELGLHDLLQPQLPLMRSKMKIMMSVLLVLAASVANAQQEKRGGRISMQVADNDSMHVLTASVLDSVTGQPLKDVGLTFYVQRMFGQMQVADGKTDSTGVIITGFKRDVRSDAKGKMVLIAKAEDDEIINNTSVRLELMPDRPYRTNQVVQRAMLARYAPWWLVITFTLVVATVWFIFAYVLVLIRRISKAGQAGIQSIK